MEDDSRKTMGLSLSDADCYDVNAAEPEEETRGTEAVPPERGKARGFVLPFILGMICCALVLLALTELLGLGKFVTRQKYEYYRDLDKNYGKYAEIMKLIGEDPVAKSDAGRISDDMLREIVAATGDPYAAYYTAEEYAEFVKKYAGEYVGIGVGVVQDGDDILVINVFEVADSHSSLKLIHFCVSAFFFFCFFITDTEIFQVVHNLYHTVILETDCSAFNGIKNLRRVKTEHGSVAKVCGGYAFIFHSECVSCVINDF